MATLLHLDSSGKGSMSVTRPLTQYFQEQWQAANKNGKVISRDLLTSNLQFVNAELVQAFYTPEDKQTAIQVQTLKQSDELINELFEADTYVIGAPMYNFSVPAVLKAYIDLVIRAGKTFSYDNGAPVGLLKNKRLIVITSSGGDYSVEPMKNFDFLEPYLRSVFGFLGVRDVHVFTAPGRDPEAIAGASAAVKKQIDGVVSLNVVA